MRTLLVVLIAAISAFGQVPTAPQQGPPPKNLTKQSDGHISANAVPADTEKYEAHVVQPGETLSQIAEMSLKDARLWPQLWEMNEHIVNPHWIYPNDKILIRPITKITEAAPPPVAVPAPAAPDAPPAVVEEAPARPPVPSTVGVAVLQNLIRSIPAEPKARDVFALPSARLNPGIKTSDLYCSGFIRSTPLPATLKVTSTYQREGALMSTDGQYVNINIGTKSGVAAGSTYQVVRPTRLVRDSSRPSASNLGTHYLDIGQIQVVQVHADSALARVIANCEAVEVGDVMVPFVHYDLPQLPRNRAFSSTISTSGGGKGSIVFVKNVVASTSSGYRTSSPSQAEGSIVAEGDVIYINMGKGDGVKSGDLFIVFHANTAIGEIAVLRVDDKSSSALVTYSTTALVVGDRVERR